MAEKYGYVHSRFFLPDFTTKQNINILANQFLQVIILFFQIGHDIKIACQLSYRTVFILHKRLQIGLDGSQGTGVEPSL